MLEHPAITKALRTGYPYSPIRESVGEDPLGNEIYPDDEILVFGDEFFLVQELSGQTIEALESIGATYGKAK